MKIKRDTYYIGRNLHGRCKCVFKTGEQGDDHISFGKSRALFTAYGYYQCGCVTIDDGCVYEEIEENKAKGIAAFFSLFNGI